MTAGFPMTGLIPWILDQPETRTVRSGKSVNKLERNGEIIAVNSNNCRQRSERLRAALSRRRLDGFTHQLGCLAGERPGCERATGASSERCFHRLRLWRLW